MKHLIAIAFAVLLFIPNPSFAGSKIQLDALDQAKPGTMSYQLFQYEIELAANTVSITIEGENGEIRTFTFTKDEAAAIISAMAYKKMERFLLRQLMASRRLQGTVAD